MGRASSDVWGARWVLWIDGDGSAVSTPRHPETDGRSDQQKQILDPSRSGGATGFGRASPEHISKGLILAQNERWRRGLGMQVVRPARDEAQG